MALSVSPIINHVNADDPHTSEQDVCSICLEAFNSLDNPATITNCKHEYHLQCILEWSQRSKECPICWQVLALKDPASQELLAAVEDERSLRSGFNIRNIYEDPPLDCDDVDTDDSDLEEHIIRSFEAASSRVHYINRWGKQGLSGVGPSQVHPSVPGADMPVGRQRYPSLEEFHNTGAASSQVDLITSSSTLASIDQTPQPVIPATVNVVLENPANRDCATKPRILDNGSPRRAIASDMHAFSESVKSKFSAASARYKDSISKSTRGLKEKLLAHNGSVKELSKGVQKEMSAGIAGVARMIERFDLASKRSAPLSSGEGANSNLSVKGKSTQDNVILLPPPGHSAEPEADLSSQVGPARC